MAIDLNVEQLITLSEACRLLPSPPSPATAWRWRVKGCNNARLECLKIGKRWYTSKESVARFIAAQNRPTRAAEATQERATTTEDRLRAAGLI